MYISVHLSVLFRTEPLQFLFFWVTSVSVWMCMMMYLSIYFALLCLQSVCVFVFVCVCTPPGEIGGREEEGGGGSDIEAEING